jgi:hypothetical protein
VTLTLRRVPDDGVQIEVRGAKARVIVRCKDVERPRLGRLVAADHTDLHWTSGVSNVLGATGFFVRDEADVADVQVGDRLRLPSSGVRTITRMLGREVWVDGDALDPIGDGYPNWIEILDRR